MYINLHIFRMKILEDLKDDCGVGHSKVKRKRWRKLRALGRGKIITGCVLHMHRVHQNTWLSRIKNDNGKSQHLMRTYLVLGRMLCSDCTTYFILWKEKIRKAGKHKVIRIGCLDGAFSYFLQLQISRHHFFFICLAIFLSRTSQNAYHWLNKYARHCIFFKEEAVTWRKKTPHRHSLKIILKRELSIKK